MALAALPAGAQQYQRLHVLQFTLNSSVAHPRVEQPFDVTLSILLRERVTEVDNVYLPTFIGAEELGDVRSTTQTAGGTLYRETLRLVAHASGTLAISSAYLDAIDARDGKPKRFYSNALRLNVAGPVPPFPWKAVEGAAIFLAALFVAGFVIRRLPRRRRPTGILQVWPPVQPAPEPLPEPAPEDPVGSALDDLRAARDRRAVMQLRGALWNAVGAKPGDTLGDVLRRPEAAQHEMRRMLLAVERAAFIDEDRLNEAIGEVLA